MISFRHQSNTKRQKQTSQYSGMLSKTFCLVKTSSLGGMNSLCLKSFRHQLRLKNANISSTLEFVDNCPIDIERPWILPSVVVDFFFWSANKETAEGVCIEYWRRWFRGWTNLWNIQKSIKKMDLNNLYPCSGLVDRQG